MALAKSDAGGAQARMRAERLLLERWQRDRDQAARDELVTRLMPLARRLARRYRRADEPFDDLVQVAVIGLVKAIDRFDHSRTTAFSSYAVPTMLGELKRHFRDHGWAVHVPRGMQERVMAVDSTIRDLPRTAGRAPSTADIAATAGLSEEEVLEAMEAGWAYEALSLEAHRYAGGSEHGATYAEVVGEDDERFDLVEYEVTLAPVLRALPARDRVVLHLRFAEDLTQAEIAERAGISQMHVSRIIRRSLERLRVVAERVE